MNLAHDIQSNIAIYLLSNEINKKKLTIIRFCIILLKKTFHPKFIKRQTYLFPYSTNQLNLCISLRIQQMGIIQAKQIKSAIKKDGLQNVKKAAFIQYSQEYLELEKSQIKLNWETQLDELLQKQIQFIEGKKYDIERMLDEKENQLQMQDVQLIDKIQHKTKKSFKELTGYRKAHEKLSIHQQLLKRTRREEIAKILMQIDSQILKVNEKLQQETPALPALTQLGDQSKQKAFSQYMEDDAFQIQRQEYHRRALQLFEKSMPFDQICQQRLGIKNTENQINGIVKDFQNNLKQLTAQSIGCNGLC